jgi:hypothetical protein
LAGALSSLVYTQTAITPASAVNGAGVSLGSITFPTGSTLRTGTTSGDTLSLSAYDVNGTVYLPLIRLAAANEPTVTLPASIGLTIADGAPATTTAKLYQAGGLLTWAGTSVVVGWPSAGLPVSTGSAWGTSLSSTAPIFGASMTAGTIASQSVIKIQGTTDASPFTYTIAAPDLSADHALTLPNGSTTLVAGTMVPTSLTVAGKALSGNITIACSDLSDEGTGCAGAAMAWPTAGIGVSTGSAWSTSLSATDPIFTGSITTGAIATQSILKLQGFNDATPFTVTLTVPDIAGDYTLVLPVDDGAASQVLTTDGSGVLSWAANGSTTLPMALSGNVSASSWSTTGAGFSVAAHTETDTSTAAAGTVAVRTANSFGAPTFASTNAITVTDGFTLYVPKPIAGTNTTLTRANSAYFEGAVGIGTTTFAYANEKLAVADATSPLISVTDTTTTVRAWLGTDDTTTYVGALTAFPVAFTVNGSTYMTLGAGAYLGRLGIGTTIPPDKLSIVGAFGVYNTYTATNYEGATLVSTTDAVALSAVTLGTGADNRDIVLTPAGTGVNILNTAAVAGAIATQDVLKLLPVTSATRFTGILTVADLTTADKTYTFPDLTGQVALVGSAIQNGADFDATGFSVAGVAGIDKTCGGPVVSATFTKGIMTAMVCTSEPQPTPAELLAMIADLRAELAALKARQ